MELLEISPTFFGIVVTTMSAMTWAHQPAMGPLREEQCPIGIRTAHRTSDDDAGGVYCNHRQNERIFGFHETRNSVSVFARIPQKCIGLKEKIFQIFAQTNRTVSFPLCSRCIVWLGSQGTQAVKMNR